MTTLTYGGRNIHFNDMEVSPYDDETRNDPVWFGSGNVFFRKVCHPHNRMYEICSVGLFCVRAPNGDYIKSYNNETEWLEQHGIHNDKDLEKIYDNEDGWTLLHSKWFELIVRERNDEGLWVTQYEGEPMHEYDEEAFKEIILEAMRDDAEDLPYLHDAVKETTVQWTQKKEEDE